MKLSELIAAYGDDKVQFQKLDESATNYSAGKRGSKITFGTDEPFGFNGTVKMGLVLWLDRDRVAELITKAKAA
ncbi:hypothetical protein NKJ71_19600 [Mesorhizobium sp. M0050]|uniref:hypothetical protein n=1 Tax=Mesorhizobium sp. M0050 TaxID=2956861 RepID=UPI00333AEC6C